MPPTDPLIGALVEVQAGRGVVRYAGTTQFSSGKWVGIELPEPNGKNDGSVKGVTYFTCKMNYGVFVRASQVTVVDPSPNEAVSKPLSAPSASVPRLAHNRQPSKTTPTPGITRTASLRSIPSNSSRAASPAKPSASSSTASLARPTPGSSRLAPASPTKRASSSSQLPPPAAIAVRRKSMALRDLSPEVHRRSPIAAAESARSPKPQHETFKSRVSSPPAPPPLLASPPVFEEEPSSPQSLRSPVAARPPSAQARLREDQELRARLRVIETKREEDAKHIRELETRLAEAENFVSIRPKLQAKLTTLQSDLISTRRALSDAESLSTMSESRLLEANEQLEMAMLDKEVAEERAEAAEAELESVMERLAVAQVELGVLKGGPSAEGEEPSSAPTPGKDRLAFIQLEKQNERLKEALIRLRDVSSQTETEQRRKMGELERDLAGIDELQTQYESTLNKLDTADMQIEDLKMQLDDALGAEEMLVQLTERNLELGEKIEEMRLAIEELEMLKELADELEEQHVETEKAMQEDLDAKDMECQQQARRIEDLEDSLQDYENTINQFRDLVLQLQSELDALRTQTQSAQTESATQASKASQIMSMNLKLQSTATKNQARNIDLELRRIEAREARELLSIVQPYLPQVYVETDSDATSCYLFFQRIALKADLINNVVAQTHGLPDSLNGPVSESLVGVCEMRGRIAHLSTLSKRFAATLRRCDVDSFLGIGRVYPEIAPIEKRIDMHIDLLKREEFRELECVSDVSKMLAQFEHLAETYFSGFEYDLGERELDLVLSFDNDLDMFSAAIGLTKTAIQNIQKDDEVVLEPGDFDAELLEPLQRLLDQCKGTKVISKKLVKRIEDLLRDSGALKAHLLPQLNSLTILVSKGVDFSIQLAQSIGGYLADVRAAKHTFQLAGVLAIVREIAAATMGRKDVATTPSWEDVGASILQLLQDGSDVLPLALEGENVVKISGVAPWVHRVEDIKSSLAVNVEAERKVAQLNEEMQDLIRGLKTRDQNIQEAGVKIELMERRMEAVKRQADTITDLEGELSKARKQERAYEEAMEQLQADLDALEQDNARLKAVVPGPERQGSGAQQVDNETVAVEGNVETSYLLEQIEALRGAVRFLRNENAYLKGYDLLKEIQRLPPLHTTPRPPTPPLDRSHTPSDSDDSEAEAAGARRPATLRTLATETKLLYRDVMRHSSGRRVVDLSALNQQRAAGARKAWMPKHQTPAHQVWERKLETEQLGRRVQGLLERAQGVMQRL